MTRPKLLTLPAFRIGLAVGMLALTAAWYVSQEDERRINETCDRWVAVRQSSRAALGGESLDRDSDSREGDVCLAAAR